MQRSVEARDRSDHLCQCLPLRFPPCVLHRSSHPPPVESWCSVPFPSWRPRAGAREPVGGTSAGALDRIGRPRWIRRAEIGIRTQSGGRDGVRTRLRNQMKRLFGCSVSLIYDDKHRETTATALIADFTDFWWKPRRPDQPSRAASTPIRPAASSDRRPLAGRRRPP